MFGGHTVISQALLNQSLPQLKTESTEILHLNPFPPHHGPCISAALPPHAYLVAIAPGMATDGFC